MLSGAEIEESLRFEHERRGFELKGPGRRDELDFFVKVVRAVLGLGNLRDGGYVVIGIDDKDPASLGPGLAEEELESWAYDEVARGLAVYADPPIDFEIGAVELSSSATVVVIEVAEFADLPHICQKAYEGKLRQGAIYVRPRRVPETSEIASHVEMRELIDLAVEKGLRAYIATAERAGVELRAGADTSYESDAAAFEAERGEAWE